MLHDRTGEGHIDQLNSVPTFTETRHFGKYIECCGDAEKKCLFLTRGCKKKGQEDILAWQNFLSLRMP